MRASDFDYDLPPELIAQEPVPDRDGARLLVLPRGGGDPCHRTFRNLPGLLTGEEVVVLNDTRVIPARLVGSRSTGGRVEVLLVEPEAGDASGLLPTEGPSSILPAGPWRCLVRPGRHALAGTVLNLAGESVPVLENRGGGEAVLDFGGVRGGDLWGFLRAAGQVPLPPYIRRPPRPADTESYQTVFAAVPGAVAAPTAGLHFTPALLDALRAMGCAVARVTLHVGPGTFRPLRSEAIAEHRMHVERYHVPPETAALVSRARREGRTVLAVGTTVVRTLEAAAAAARAAGATEGEVAAGPGATDLFIYPGYRFRVVDALLTNFHLPRSTLLLLVSALAGRDRILSAYREAIALRYRFFSYGDAMLIR